MDEFSNSISNEFPNAQGDYLATVAGQTIYRKEWFSDSILLDFEDHKFPAPIGFDANKYINTMFRMYDAPRKEVELVCDNGVMDAIVDRFGSDVEIYACDQQHFRVITEIAIGNVFFNWIFGFGGLVSIKAPEDVREQYIERVLKAMETLVK